MSPEVEQVGPWRLESGHLGEGGNAIVRLGHHMEHGEVAAVKLLKTRKITSEPYLRFVTEIEALRSIGPTPGILHVVDSYLPTTPSRSDRPWLAMPVATPITEGLKGQPLTEVVRAVHAIALTLAGLHADHHIAHRDIKPANLYLYEGEYVIGDFGLVAVPDLDELVKTGRPLGPTFFMADEMISDAKAADPYPADVFSLAKTLWVLGAEERTPPQGHLRDDALGLRLSDRRPDPRATTLDRIIERATRANPQSRPTMSAFAAELGGWLSDPVPVNQQDLSKALAEIRSLLKDEAAEEDAVRRRINAASRASGLLTEALVPLNTQLAVASPTARFGAADTFSANLAPRATVGSPRQIFTAGYSSWIPALEDRYELRIGRCVTLLETGDLLFDAAIMVGLANVLGGVDFYWQMPRRSVPVESTLVEREIDQVVALISEQIGPALDAFSQGVRAGKEPTA